MKNLLAARKGGFLLLADLRAILHYEPETGVWTWLETRSRGAVAGVRAGTIRPDGYRVINIMGTIYRSSRLAHFYMTGSWPSRLLDHVNGVRGDDRWANLRPATEAQNSANCARPVTNTSGFKGVYWSKHASRWRAQISINGRTKNLGYFDTPERAHAAYMVAADVQYGEFARAA